MDSALRIIGILFLVGLAALLVPGMTTKYYFALGAIQAVLVLTFIVLGASISFQGPPLRRIGTGSDLSVTLPRPDEVLKITAYGPLSAPGPRLPFMRDDWYTPDSLLQILPQLRPTKHTYTKLPFQMGTIVLRDGTVLNWRAGSSESLLLYDDKAKVERHYVVPGSDDDTGDLEV